MSATTFPIPRRYRLSRVFPIGFVAGALLTGAVALAVNDDSASAPVQAVPSTPSAHTITADEAIRDAIEQRQLLEERQAAVAAHRALPTSPDSAERWADGGTSVDPRMNWDGYSSVPSAEHLTVPASGPEHQVR